MKPARKIPVGKNVAAVDALKVQTKHEPEPVADVAATMAAIQMRANYVGPVLEGILQANHACVNWDGYG